MPSNKFINLPSCHEQIRRGVDHSYYINIPIFKPLEGFGKVPSSQSPKGISLYVTSGYRYQNKVPRRGHKNLRVTRATPQPADAHGE